MRWALTPNATDFIKIELGSEKLIGRLQRHTAWRPHKPTLGMWAKNHIRDTQPL
jgi:hypothetical protein